MDEGLLPNIVNPVPATVTFEMVRVAVPEFVSFTVWLLLAPTATVPKLAVAGLTVKAGVGLVS
jgi:hypothetical protein